MDPGILRRRLYEWRAERAQRDGVSELFRVLPTSTVDAIAMTQPTSMEELIGVKGIKDAKAAKYGDEILAVIRGIAPSALAPTPVSPPESVDGSGDLITYSVSVYLDILNRAVSQYTARIVGETLGVKTQGGYTYLSLLDPTNRSVMRVMIPRLVMDFSGIALADGMDVAVSGRSDIYKPSGALTFRAETLELVGEGALKKQYDDLKKKFIAEGLFSEEKKRALPDYPVRIGVLTSRTGAVIHDFQSNLGHHGFKIRFKDIRVEGAQAVPDILAGLARMKKESLDVLVLIRGGGSMESLQAFNNEQVVRALSAFPSPVVCAIGHDKDVPLAQMVADAAPSTPTAAAELLNRSWREGGHLVQFFTKDIMSVYHEQLWTKKEQVSSLERSFISALSGITSLFAEATRDLSDALLWVQKALTLARGSLLRESERISATYVESLRNLEREITEQNKVLVANNPTRHLRLGYSILSRRGSIIRSLADLPSGTDFEATLSDGTLSAISRGKKSSTA